MVDIRAIRERSEKATPGPWHDNAFHGIVTSGGDWNTSDSVSVADIIRRDDGTFIAAARTDVPALCDEVEECRARIAHLELNEKPLSCLCPAETQTAPRPYSDGEIRSFRINGGGCDLARGSARPKRIFVGVNPDRILGNVVHPRVGQHRLSDNAQCQRRRCRG